MEFKIDTVNNYYSEKSCLEQVNRLGKLGFQSKFIKNGYFEGKYEKKDGQVSTIINSIDDLVTFIENYGTIIMDEDTIIIYDGYNE